TQKRLSTTSNEISWPRFHYIQGKEGRYKPLCLFELLISIHLSSFNTESNDMTYDDWDTVTSRPSLLRLVVDFIPHS
ncbi:hypothetical protein PROFUN_16502, partial [Planoprotostelium fungivorum]